MSLKNNRMAHLCLLTGLLAIMGSQTVLAVHPGRWEHTTEADFDEGQTQNVLITNLGDIKLAAKTRSIGKLTEHANVIFDLQYTSDHTLFLATGPHAKLLQRTDKTFKVVLDLPDEQLFALDVLPDGRLLLGLSGNPSRLAVLQDGQLHDLATLKKVRYIWDMLVENHTLYLATGIEGKLLQIALPDPLPVFQPAHTAVIAPAADAVAIPATVAATVPAPKNIALQKAAPVPSSTTNSPSPTPATPATSQPATLQPATSQPATSQPAAAPPTSAQTNRSTSDNPKTETPPDPRDKNKKTSPVRSESAKLQLPVKVILDTHQANLLCLGRDGQGRLYVGTDQEGLIYRISLDAKGNAHPFVLYDAPEPEIGCLIVRQDGTVFAGTANANQARPGRLAKAASKEQGRPTTKSKNNDKTKKPPVAPHVPPTPKPVRQSESATPETPTATSTKTRSATPTSSTPDTQSPTTTDLPDKPQTASDNTPPNSDTPTHKAAPNKPKPITPDQQEALRQEVRQRLLAARASGHLAPRDSHGTPPPPPAATAAAPMAGGGRHRPIKRKKPTGRGNAVYRISADGFVREIFRESVMILKMLQVDGKLMVATGNEGQLFQIDPDAEETTILTSLTPQQIPSLIQGPDRKILLGTANPAQLIELTPGYASKGTYTSKILDAKQISRWGKINFVADIPQKTTIQIQTRSGNVADPDKAAWSEWSSPKSFSSNPAIGALAPRTLANLSPAARFIQYRVTFTSRGNVTPTLDRINLAYALPNFRPQIQAITATYPDQKITPTTPPGSNANLAASNKEPLHHTKLKIQWKATDPNGDKLQYKLAFQIAGTRQWIKLKDHLTTNRFEWNTLRTPDGRYLLRVTASDHLDNPPAFAQQAMRTSNPVLVDNTPPVLRLKTTVGKHQISVTGTVTDALSPIRAAHYCLDAYHQWKSILPQDMIYDSTNESLAFIISDLSPGEHVITFRVLDQRNNAVYKAMTFQVK